MRTTITRIALALLAVIVGSTLLAASPGALAPGEVRYVVTLAAGAHSPDIAALGGRLEASDGSVLTIVLPSQAAKTLANDPAVQSIAEASPGTAARRSGAAPSHHVTNDRFRLTPQDAITLWGSGEYVYDGAGNITAMGITGALNGDGKTSTFTYDLASRLKNASIGRASGGDIVESYTYDGFGNLKQHNRTSPDTISYPATAYPPSLTSNRMTEPGVEYDLGASSGPGNVTAIGGQTLTYDAFNQVVTKSSNGNSPPDYTYIYDVNEERIGAQHGSSTTHWTIRDFDNKPLIAFDGPPASAPTQTTWTWAESFAWAGGTMLMAERPIVGQLHYHVDNLGSTRVITDANGQLIAGGRSDYAPFGEEIPMANSEPIKFTGHERDYDLSNPTADTYLDYMHARYYDPRRGRFLSVDPSLDKKSVTHRPQAWNRYAYTDSNPLTFFDPDGRAKEIHIVQSFAADITDFRWSETESQASNGYEVVPHRIGGELTAGAVLSNSDSTDFAILFGHGSASGMADQQFWSMNDSKSFNSTNVMTGSWLADQTLEPGERNGGPLAGVVLAGCNTISVAREFTKNSGVASIGTTGLMNTAQHKRAINALVAYISQHGQLDEGAVSAMNKAAGGVKCNGKGQCANGQYALVPAPK